MYMAFYNRRYSAGSRQAACQCFPASDLPLVRFFVKLLIVTNVNISNKLNFSDVYRSVNYFGLLAIFHEPRKRLNIILHFDNSQKN